MTDKSATSERFSNLVAPLAHQATVTRATDTTGQGDLFGRSGAVTAPIGAAPGLRRGDVDSAAGPRTPATTLMRGARTSETATRTTTTRTTSSRSSWSADQTVAGSHAGFSLADWVNAYLACRRTKRRKHTATAFEINQEAELTALQAAVADGSYTPGPSTCFIITRPRPREVWAAEFRDRVVHHLLYNAIGPAIERTFIADSCACIPGRGTLYAVRRLEHHVRSASHNWSRPAWYLKMDLANFFVSIDKAILADQLRAKIRDPQLLDLALQILWQDPRPGAVHQSDPKLMARVPPHKRLSEAPAGKGLPIGNLSSQFYANIHLDALDQFVKQRLRVRHYVRYVDDFVLLHESPQQLNAWRAQIEAFLPERLQLQVNPAKTILQPVARGIDFVGQVIRPWRTTLRRRTYKAAIQRISTINDTDLFATANSYLGLLRQANHSHTDRVRIANLLRKRGRCVDAGLTKTYRSAACR